jgi:hypothetical protein
MLKCRKSYVIDIGVTIPLDADHFGAFIGLSD